MPNDRCAARRDKLLRSMCAQELAGLLVSCETNVSYLTGFRGDSSALLIGAGVCLLISDGRYTTQIAQECPGLDVYIRRQTETMTAATAKCIRRAKLTKLGVEADHISFAQARKIEDDLKRIELVPTVDAVEELRQIKDNGEIAAIREAIRLAERGFEVLKAELHGEQTERQVAWDLEHRLRAMGARGCSFAPIVAAGKRSALPHARPGDGRISEGEFVLVDWGAEVMAGYRSDLTRILSTAKLSPKLERVYGVVLKAQRAALRCIRPGMKACDVDRVARRVIEAHGFGKRFSHGLGHGIGLDIHEGPRLNASSEATLKAGMVVTVEPGIYIEGWGGVRIEDDVLVTREGCEVLSSAPKDPTEIMVG